MVTLKEAWNSYLLLLQSLKKALPQKNSTTWMGSNF